MNDVGSNESNQCSASNGASSSRHDTTTEDDDGERAVQRLLDSLPAFEWEKAGERERETDNEREDERRETTDKEGKCCEG